MTSTLRGKQAPEWQFNLVMTGFGLSLILLLIGCISLSIFFQIGAVTGMLFSGIGAILIPVEQSITERLIVGVLMFACAFLLAYRFF